MRRAIELSKVGMEGGFGGPFGAVVVRDGEIIGEGHNQVLRLNDPTAHGEVMAIRDAPKNVCNPWLEGSELYTSCQPCPMCLGATLWSHIGVIHYAATDLDAAGICFDDAVIDKLLQFDLNEIRLQVHQLMQPEAVAVMQGWLQKGKQY